MISSRRYVWADSVAITTAISDTGLTLGESYVPKRQPLSTPFAFINRHFFWVSTREFHGKYAFWFLINSVPQFNVTCKFYYSRIEIHSTAINTAPLFRVSTPSFSRHSTFTMQTSNYKTQLYVPGVMLMLYYNCRSNAHTQPLIHTLPEWQQAKKKKKKIILRSWRLMATT